MSEQSEKGTISAEELCKLTGLSDRRHRQLATKGYFPPPIKGRYQAKAAIAGTFKHYREQMSKRDEELAQEQRMLTKAKRETAETELAILRQQLIKKDDLGPALRNVMVNFRAALQRKFEIEVPTTLVGLREIEIKPRMAKAVDNLCTLLQEGLEQWIPRNEAGS